MNIRTSASAILAAAALLVAWQLHRRAEINPEVVVSVPDARAPEYISTNGGVLVIAWVKGYETFQRRNLFEVTLPSGNSISLPLGETFSEVSTAARYQYQIRLEKRWPIHCTEQECVVKTGPVELADPVAIYHEETRRKTTSGWGRFNKAENLEALNRTLGKALQVTGELPKNRSVAERDGRAEIEKFVRTWAMMNGIGSRRIVVLYPGEERSAGPDRSSL